MKQDKGAAHSEADSAAPAELESDPGVRLSLLDLWRILWPARWTVLAIAFVGTALTAGYSLIVPQKWRSTAVLLPVQDSNDSLGAALRALPALAVGGLGDGQTSPTDRLIMILTSRSVTDSVAESLGLAQLLFEDRWDAEKKQWTDEVPDPREVNRRMRENHLFVEQSRLGAINVSVTWGDPDTAARIANAYVSALNLFLKNATISQAKRTRLFLEKQIVETNERLQAAEETLLSFSEETQRVVLDSGTSELLSATSDLMTDIAAKQVAMMVMGNFVSPEDDIMQGFRGDIDRLRERLEALTRAHDATRGGGKVAVPFQKVPLLTLEYLRLRQQVQILRNIQSLLQEELERTRMREASEEIGFEVLDPAQPPHVRVWPKRTLMVVVGAFVWGAVALAYVFGRHFWRRGAFRDLLQLPEEEASAPQRS